MSLRDRPFTAFFSLAGGLFIFSTLGADVFARTTAGAQSFLHAVTEHAYYAFVQPIGTALLLTPFLLLAWMSATLAKSKDFDHGLPVFLVGAFLLALMYFSGYYDSQTYMEQKMWTAAILSVGLLPLKSVPVLFICLGVRWLMKRRNSDSKT